MTARIAFLAVFGVCVATAVAQDVLTYHNDLARTGQYKYEKTLNPANVNTAQFGKLFVLPVDGAVYAQPLYLAGKPNVVFVATEHDSVYAFNADVGTLLWHASFINPQESEIPISSPSYTICGVLTPEVGITGTPVIDRPQGTLYVVASTLESHADGSTPFVHRLHALDITTGAERPGSPVLIAAQGFNPDLQFQRAGLVLANGTVFIAWSSHCDRGRYHGWILGYDSRTLKQVAVYNSTAEANAGSFWASGAAPAVDADGNMFVISGNGDFDASRGGTALGNSFIKLSTKQGLAVVDYFAPFNVFSLSDLDIDLGSSGAVLLPEEAGGVGHLHVLVSAGKEGRIYVVDRDNMGHYQAESDSQIVQSLKGSIQPLFGDAAYFDGKVFFASVNDYPKAFAIREGMLSTEAVSKGPEKLGHPGAVPSVSANGSSGGIVWLIDSGAVLRAYDAADLSREVFSGDTGSYVKFSVPTIAGGKVFVGTQNSLVVFGEYPARRRAPPAEPAARPPALRQ